MQIYLPIAEMSVPVELILAMGLGVGMLSGIFGVGGGFLMTPLLMFIGVPPAIAVGTEANQIVASSVSGVLAHMRRGNVDFKMGAILTVGGFIGSFSGVYLFAWLKTLGQIDLAIKLSYVVFLGIVGGLMFIESLQALFKSKKGGSASAARGARASIPGCTACRSRCGSAAPSSTSRLCCRSPSASWSACWRRSWASAAGSSWSRR